MAVKRVEMALVLFSVLVLWNGTAAQSGCTSALMSLSPCLNYVDGNSSTPSPSCCSQLSNIVQSQPRCLCSLLNGSGSSMGITVNQTLALALPGACDVQTPPVSECNGQHKAATASAPANSAVPIPGPASAPVGSPAESPADSSDDTPTTGSDSDIPSEGTGSKTVPMTGVSSDGITIKSTLHIAVFLVFVISSASAATGF
ncbi:non-specific lipid transfer protein GPI-anchored 5-like [Rhododendron vialii]|uniref:non-specific lipid transfer protein GPI-anchored 5-like n=1 Tax=Rhododendron vialii TaxID=182163 RepID=UPI00265E376B|nr:non-specific lipid transfer protein GPI-anchored 5-like [Rhododendron vialii]